MIGAMIFGATIFALGLIAGVLVCFLLDRRLFAELQSEREAGRQEAKVYRNLLFPVMARVDNVEKCSGSTPEPGAAQVPRPVGVGSGKAKPQPPNPLLNRRIPWRARFKMIAAAHNTAQQRTDALASALAAQKPSQEKSNVTA